MKCLVGLFLGQNLKRVITLTVSKRTGTFNGRRICRFFSIDASRGPMTIALTGHGKSELAKHVVEELKVKNVRVIHLATEKMDDVDNQDFIKINFNKHIKEHKEKEVAHLLDAYNVSAIVHLDQYEGNRAATSFQLNKYSMISLLRIRNLTHQFPFVLMTSPVEAIAYSVALKEDYRIGGEQLLANTKSLAINHVMNERKTSVLILDHLLDPVLKEEDVFGSSIRVYFDKAERSKAPICTEYAAMVVADAAVEGGLGLNVPRQVYVGGKTMSSSEWEDVFVPKPQHSFSVKLFHLKSLCELTGQKALYEGALRHESLPSSINSITQECLDATYSNNKLEARGINPYDVEAVVKRAKKGSFENRICLSVMNLPLYKKVLFLPFALLKASRGLSLGPPVGVEEKRSNDDDDDEIIGIH